MELPLANLMTRLGAMIPAPLLPPVSTAHESCCMVTDGLFFPGASPTIASMSSMGKMLKQAKKMEQQMAKIQSDLAEQTVEKTSGGGAVKAVASCDGVLKSIKISPEAVDPEDVELLEDMILTAVSGAIKEAKEISDTEMARVTQGLSLPGMM